MTKKYFISATSDTDTSAVVSILGEFGIEPVYSSDLPFTSGSVTSMLSSAISHSDAFLAILPASPASSSGVLFEAGMAAGLGKPVLVVAPRNVVIPEQLSTAAVVHTPLDHPETLKFAVEALQQAPKRPKPPTRRRHSKGKLLGTKAIAFKERLASLEPEGSGAETESLVADLFKTAGARSIAESRHDEGRADLAIWVDELSGSVGNPILVEVKQRVPSTLDAAAIASKLILLLHSTPSKMGIVVYRDGIPPAKAQEADRTARILFFALSDLIDQLTTHSLASVIRSARNQLIHRGNS